MKRCGVWVTQAQGAQQGQASAEAATTGFSSHISIIYVTTGLFVSWDKDKMKFASQILTFKGKKEERGVILCINWTFRSEPSLF